MLLDELSRQLQPEMLTAKLRSEQDSMDSATKMTLWEQVKIDSVTRTVAGALALSLLVVQLRTKLNIIGGYLYLSNIAVVRCVCTEPATWGLPPPPALSRPKRLKSNPTILLPNINTGCQGPRPKAERAVADALPRAHTVSAL